MLDHDPQAAVEAALGAARKLLARRRLSAAELATRLERAGHPRAASAAVLDRFRAAGYLNDLDLAVDHVARRAVHPGLGASRLRQELARRGISSATFDRAWQLVQEREGWDEASLLEMRTERELAKLGTALDSRSLRRVYNALVRAGFPDEAVRARLEELRDLAREAGEDGEHC